MKNTNKYWEMAEPASKIRSAGECAAKQDCSEDMCDEGVEINPHGQAIPFRRRKELLYLAEKAAGTVDGLVEEHEMHLFRHFLDGLLE